MVRFLYSFCPTRRNRINKDARHGMSFTTHGNEISHQLLIKGLRLKRQYTPYQKDFPWKHHDFTNEEKIRNTKKRLFNIFDLDQNKKIYLWLWRKSLTLHGWNVDMLSYANWNRQKTLNENNCFTRSQSRYASRLEAKRMHSSFDSMFCDIINTKQKKSSHQKLAR